MTWKMPAETDPHDRTWMAFPVASTSFGEHASSIEEARAAWTSVAHAIAEFEPVTMVVDPREVEQARQHLSSSIDTIVSPLDDAWIRDMGPTFVIDDKGRLAGVDWIFNGWGGGDGPPLAKDAGIAARVIGAARASQVSSVLV